MKKILSLLLLILSFLLASCASGQPAVVAVNSPEMSTEYVVQVDDKPGKIVKPGNRNVGLDSGSHHVRLTYAGKTIADTVVTVKADDTRFYATWMGMMAFSAGLMTVVWLPLWFVLLTPSAWITAMLATPAQEIPLDGLIKLEEPLVLYTLDNPYFRVKSFHSNMGLSSKGGVDNVARVLGACYDASTRIVWVQSEANRAVYPFAVNEDIDLCIAQNGGIVCESGNNKLLESMPCK